MQFDGLGLAVDEAMFKILISCLLCGLIGLEREYRQKAAGFRTHLLVGLGSTLFTLLSIEGFGGADPSRVAAQIVSGIGFIGGGAILRHGLSVRGVTTAATLWLVAAIGMAVAVGWYGQGLTATAVALLTLIALTNLERILPSLPTPMQVQLKVVAEARSRPGLDSCLEAAGWSIRRGQLDRTPHGALRLTYMIRHPAGTTEDLAELIRSIEGVEGVSEIGWEILEAAS